jgi:hypothetical protein
MSTDKPTVEDVEETSSDSEAPAEESAEQETDPSTGPPDDSSDDSPDDSSDDSSDGPNWWHRDHPTFAALSGFFTGLLFVALVPAIYVGVLSLMLDNQRVEDLFPFVLVTLVVPLALVVNPRTRRFGTYFWIGMVLTAIVVVGVGALVLWYLVENQS